MRVQYELWGRLRKHRVITAVPGALPNTITLRLTSGGTDDTMAPAECVRQFGGRETCRLKTQQGRDIWHYDVSPEFVKAKVAGWRKKFQREGFEQLHKDATAIQEAS